MTFDLDTIKRYAEALFAAPWWLLSALFSFFICCALRRSKWFPNQFIPTVCLVLCATLTVLAAPPAPAGTPIRAYRLAAFMAGGILGALVWGGHRAILKPLSEKWPWLKGLLEGIYGEDTAIISKVDVEPKPDEPPKS